MSSKKAIVLNGSPRRNVSSTMHVTDAFIEGLKKGGYEVTVINIADLKITPCLGCLSCWAKTAGKCVIKNDDINNVMNQINESDIVIESFPLYFFGMPGIMKVFTDRMMPMMSTYVGERVPMDGSSFHGIRNPKEGQKLVIISSCAYTESDFVYDSLKTQYDCICGKDNYTSIFVPQIKTLIDLHNENKLNKFLQKFTDAGLEFANNKALSDETTELLKKPPFSVGAYKTFLAMHWEEERNAKSEN